MLLFDGAATGHGWTGKNNPVEWRPMPKFWAPTCCQQPAPICLKDVTLPTAKDLMLIRLSGGVRYSVTIKPFHYRNWSEWSYILSPKQSNFWHLPLPTKEVPTTSYCDRKGQGQKGKVFGRWLGIHWKRNYFRGTENVTLINGFY